MPSLNPEIDYLLGELTNLQSNRENIELFLRDGEAEGCVPISLARALIARSARLRTRIEEVRRQLDAVQTNGGRDLSR